MVAARQAEEARLLALSDIEALQRQVRKRDREREGVCVCGYRPACGYRHACIRVSSSD